MVFLNVLELSYDKNSNKSTDLVPLEGEKSEKAKKSWNFAASKGQVTCSKVNRLISNQHPFCSMSR